VRAALPRLNLRLSLNMDALGEPTGRATSKRYSGRWYPTRVAHRL